MSRCFDLARRGIGAVSPNPPVGAVLVHQDKILSEGFHHYFGGPHAEVDAISKVAEKDRSLIGSSILYVSLEPCCITGKTGPCTELIIAEGIKEVRISALDPNRSVAGKGVERLRSQGIHVIEGILREEGEQLIRAFNTNMRLERPHILLKWAQSKYGYSGIEGQQIWLSETPSSLRAHRLRAEADAIMVGARTVATDDPSLTTRAYPGKSPQRVIFDPNGRLTENYKVFDDDGCLVHYYSLQPNHGIKRKHIRCVQLNDDLHMPEQIMQDLFNHQVGIVLVEGGPFLHQQFIRMNLWDEAWVIRTQHPLAHGLVSPNVHGVLLAKEQAERDTIIGILNEK